MSQRSAMALLAAGGGAVLMQLALRSLGGPVEAIAMTSEGHEVAALLVRSEKPTRQLLVVTHGGLATKETMLPLCWEARRRGFDCVAVDLLGHGGSSPMPRQKALAAMSQALRGMPLLAQYDDVRFVGHSLGAVVGCGPAFECGRAVALGQHVGCGRAVFGALHRNLGLPASGYLLSHVLEPWTPNVIDRVIAMALGVTGPGVAGVAVMLAWYATALGLLAGLLGASLLRAAFPRSGAVRGLVGAGAVWAGLALGSSQSVWRLWPTQGDDVPFLGVAGLVTLAVTGAMGWIGVRGATAGALAGGVIAWVVGVAAWFMFPALELRSLMRLVPVLVALVVPLAWLGERLTRPRDAEGVEAGVFVATLLGLAVALLTPSVRG